MPAAKPMKTKPEVVDARGPVVIHITKSDVQRGTLKDASTCAAAKALCRADDVEAAQVYIGRTYVKRAGKWYRYATPPALRNEIIAFDRGGTFEPGDYTLTPVQPVVQYKNREKRAEYLRKMKAYNATPARRKQKQEQEKLREDRKARKRGHVVKNIRRRAGFGPVE